MKRFRQAARIALWTGCLLLAWACSENDAGECLDCLGGDPDADAGGEFDADSPSEAEPEEEAPACDGSACDDDADCSPGCICAAGACEEREGTRFDLETADSLLVYRNDAGRVDIYTRDGDWIVRGATARVMLDAADEDGAALTVADAGIREVARVTADEDALGTADRLVVRAGGAMEGAALVWTLSAYPDAGFYTFAVELANDTGETLQFAKASAFELSGQEGGGLFLGGHPSTHRILENGSYTYLDFYAAVQPGDVPQDPFTAAGVPGDFKGHSVSNLNHGVLDLDGGAVWIAGALTFEHSLPVINLSYDPAASAAAPDGRAGFSYFSAEATYEPLPKPVPPGGAFSTETFYIHPAETGFFEGMENWALAVKRMNDITLWTEKAEGNRVPNGWNSWSTSGSTGGYGTSINEEVILANLEVMTDEFRDWGMDWFQIDDGYEPAYGDWWWREDRFPHGPAWMAQQIRDRGFKPGLWMAPFTHHSDSQTLAEHPDWFAGPDFFPPAYKVLDLTHPEVKAYLADLFTTFRNDWGFDWLKMDFSYHALFGGEFHDPTQTREEAYRGACRIIREAIGPDTFFLAVSALGPHLGLIDADRLTLDNMPVWDKQPEDSEDSPLSQQGFKPTVRTAARRYYFHNRVWINHSDLIVFRSNPRDETWPRVTLDEAQAFCTYVGLTGGIVKLGDKLVDLQTEHINSVRKLLPIYGKGARPLDLLEREFPEKWLLHVDSSLDGYDETYDLLGLFHWGSNRDMSRNPYQKMEDDGADRRIDIDLGGLGMDPSRTYLAYEFWTETYLGEVTGNLAYDVPTHTGRVIALRAKTGAPQFLGWNRQITMGATDIRSLAWDETAGTLTLRTKVAKGSVKAPFVYAMQFYAPEECAFVTARYDGSPVADARESREGEVLKLSFEAQETGEVTISLTFTCGRGGR
ncbi:MAG: alpha-galactosidase [Myxococcales bacterium]|nr:MAG: alpha-galactosidase [Myxococcales bacterium]